MQIVREIGPHVVSGHLFFKLLDGSTISCECIKGPYAEKIVEAWKHRNYENTYKDA